MARRSWILHAVMLAILAGLAVRVSEVKAEIKAVANTSPTPTGERQLKLVSSEPLHLQCWQVGVKIIDEREVGSISVRSLLDQGTVSFGGGMFEHPTVIVLSLQDSTCLIESRK